MKTISLTQKELRALSKSLRSDISYTKGILQTFKRSIADPRLKECIEENKKYLSLYQDRYSFLCQLRNKLNHL